MEEIKSKVQEPDGSVREVVTIANDWDHVGNLIAEGALSEADRYRTLYEGLQSHDKHMEERISAMNEAIRRVLEKQNELADAIIQLMKV